MVRADQRDPNQHFDQANGTGYQDYQAGQKVGVVIKNRVQVVYDRQCPVCDYYCQRIDIDESAGELVRIDAREQSDVLDEVTASGLDIDEGMVVKANDRIYYGSDAIHQLALLGSRKGFLNRCAYWLFHSKTAARTLYPVLAACRNLLLKLLGRSRINNLKLENNDRF